MSVLLITELWLLPWLIQRELGPGFIPKDHASVVVGMSNLENGSPWLNDNILCPTGS